VCDNLFLAPYCPNCRRAGCKIHGLGHAQRYTLADNHWARITRVGPPKAQLTVNKRLRERGEMAAAVNPPPPRAGKGFWTWTPLAGALNWCHVGGVTRRRGRRRKRRRPRGALQAPAEGAGMWPARDGVVMSARTDLPAQEPVGLVHPGLPELQAGRHHQQPRARLRARSARRGEGMG
jgi:hypothetical protein